MAKVGHKKGDKGSGVYPFSKRPRDSISVRDYTPQEFFPPISDKLYSSVGTRCGYAKGSNRSTALGVACVSPAVAASPRGSCAALAIQIDTSWLGYKITSLSPEPHMVGK
jgi:hypothetical protein